MVIFALVGAGLINGLVTYVHRSGDKVINDPKANAIIVHIILAVVALVIGVSVYMINKKKNQASLFLKPFSEHAYLRVKATLTFYPKLSILSLVRFVATIFLLYILLWEPFRMAMQLIAALDPNFTANAWGGPSYLGATLAHWLDGILLFYGTALLLHFVMVREPRKITDNQNSES